MIVEIAEAMASEKPPRDFRGVRHCPRRLAGVFRGRPSQFSLYDLNGGCQQRMRRALDSC